MEKYEIALPPQSCRARLSLLGDNGSSILTNHCLKQNWICSGALASPSGFSVRSASLQSPCHVPGAFKKLVSIVQSRIYACICAHFSLCNSLCHSFQTFGRSRHVTCVPGARQRSRANPVLLEQSWYTISYLTLLHKYIDHTHLNELAGRRSDQDIYVPKSP